MTSRTTTRASRARRVGAVAAVGVLALAATSCGTSSGSGSSSSSEGGSGFTAPDVPMTESLGEDEGEVSILAWPGYAEDGSTYKAYDWVTPFEEQTGCTANIKVFGTSDEAVKLMQSGQYDVVSASGDASLRLIASGDVAPVNTDLLTSYDDIADFLKDQAWNSVDGQMYGVPHGWGANLLMYNADEVTPAPTSWGAVFDDASEYSGKVTAYDSPIYIADAALYLMATQPDLGIENPYALDTDQLAAAVDLLKTQKESLSEYWSDYLKEVQAFKTGDSVIGTSWEVIAQVAQSEDVPVETVLPDEGSTGWSDTWMISSQAEHPNCAYEWMNWITSAEVQAEVAQYFGEAPANTAACDYTAKGFCDDYHVTDSDYASKIWYWTTPISECLDGRTDTECTDYGDWVTAWTEVKG
ncbi:ABC transporter substrate-binding protein [Nocardioides sp. GY 10127]|uniref:ABC transporter substrate-binding protein n=1 Tax=Nocardioides sp. GY 10127 TaxID=2569762 RepID=UPI0010A76A47|nr:ABC transporter substrate-binding protein [Nocardioides sp. GY 10127]TIC80877.1 ABC transporter substrate-binding protein [Nocardioides sp. GY 10127]